MSPTSVMRSFHSRIRCVVLPWLAMSCSRSENVRWKPQSFSSASALRSPASACARASIARISSAQAVSLSVRSRKSSSVTRIRSWRGMPIILNSRAQWPSSHAKPWMNFRCGLIAS